MYRTWTVAIYLFYSLNEMLGTHKLGAFDLIVLLALMRLNEAAYGVSIAKTIEESTGRSVAQATLYVTLGRLERKGLIASRLGEPTAERGGRAKRYFRITAKGVREVRAAQRLFTSLWAHIPALTGDPA
jgi:DNA-binding PadR family transcriptional regulator